MKRYKFCGLQSQNKLPFGTNCDILSTNGGGHDDLQTFVCR